MKLNILKHNELYSFELKAANGGGVFKSTSHYFLVPGVKPYYKVPWKAYHTASKIMKKASHHVYAASPSFYGQDDEGVSITDISGEKMLSNHYVQILQGIKDRIKKKKDKKESKNLYSTIKMVEGELNFLEQQIEDEKAKKQFTRLKKNIEQIKKKHFPKEYAKDEAEKKKQAEAPPPPPPGAEMGMPGAEMGMPEMPPLDMPPVTASIYRQASLDKDAKQELLETYGAFVCEVVSERIKECLYKVGNDSVVAYVKSSGENEPLIKITTNDTGNINGIFPLGILAKKYPLHSAEFYQLFWKPIVEKIGHYFVEEHDLLIVPEMHALPDVPKVTPLSMDVRGWSSKDQGEKVVSLSIKGDENPIWLFASKKIDKTAATMEEMDLLGATIRCIDPNQKSLKDRTGQIVEIIDIDTYPYLIYSIDFGHKIQRLSKDKVEIISKR